MGPNVPHGERGVHARFQALRWALIKERRVSFTHQKILVCQSQLRDG